MDLFLQGLVLGFSIAAPVGPIGLLCIRRTLAGGRAAGLASGLGAATADAVYGSIAGFGLTAVQGFLVEQAFWLQLIGGTFLIYLGVRTFLAPPAEREAPITGTGLVGAYGSTFVLTLTNPLTILSFAAMFAAAGLANTGGDYAAAARLVGGVFAGSALWWLALSGGVGLLRARITPGMLQWVNRISGALIALLGMGALASLLGGA